MLIQSPALIVPTTQHQNTRKVTMVYPQSTIRQEVTTYKAPRFLRRRSRYHRFTQTDKTTSKAAVIDHMGIVADAALKKLSARALRQLIGQQKICLTNEIWD